MKFKFIFTPYLNFIYFVLFGLMCELHATEPDPLVRFKNVSETSIKWHDDQNVDILEYFESAPPALEFVTPLDPSLCEMNGRKLSGLQLVSLKLGDKDHNVKKFTLSCKSSARHKSVNIKIHLLGREFPKFEIHGASKINQKVILTPFTLNANLGRAVSIVNPNGSGHLLILNPSGSIYYYKRLKDYAIDFRAHSLEGKPYYSYLKIEAGYPNFTLTGRRVVLNENFEVIDEPTWQSDAHEFLMLGEKHYLTALYESRTNAAQNCEVYPVLKEYKNNKVVYSYDLSELGTLGLRFSPSALVKYGGETCIHFMHLNYIHILDQDRMLLGTIDMIFVFNKKLKKIEWVFGGFNTNFPLPSEDVMFYAHTPDWDSEKNILRFYKNGSPVTASNRGPEIVEVGLDINNKSITSYRKTSLTNFRDTDISYMGSAYFTAPDVYSVSFGIKKDFKLYDFVELKSGQPTFKIRFAKPYNLPGYRVYRH